MVYFIGLLSIVFIIEFLVIQWKVNHIEELHYHQNFARKSQLVAKEIELSTYQAIRENQLSTANQAGAPELLAQIDQYDHLLEIIGKGGRIDGSSIFLSPLSRLPRISFEEIQKHWNAMKVFIQPLAEGTFENRGNERTLYGARWISLSSWYDKLIIDLDKDIEDSRNRFVFVFLLFGFIDLGLIVLLFYAFKNGVLKPLKAIEINTKQHEHTLNIPDNELGKVAQEVNEVIEQLRDASEFVRRIGEGDLKVEYQELDSRYTQGKNKLADSLVVMKGKLKELSDEDRKRQWVNEGLTKFVDILRSSDENISILGDKIISTLTKYTDSNQGSLYLLNDEDVNNKHLELISLFAFDIKKFENKKIKLGEGLLGQTFLEKETTFIKDVPEEYIRITSGLGGDRPKSILIVPLKIDKDVYGVVELASFNIFKDYEIGFVERIGEAIASTLATVKASQQTRRLLDESKSATEMMRSQEEEMRQNMEELQATQEEMARKERDYISKIEELEQQKNDEPLKQALQESQAELAKVMAVNESKIKSLQEELQKAPKQDDWVIAQEVEKAFRINMEAMRVTKAELGSKRKS